MVTINPAIALGLDDKIGRVRPGYYADLAVFRKRLPDPYRSLVEATERDVCLVLVGGVPHYGDLAWMRQLKGDDLEPLTVQGVDKAIDVTDPGIPGGEETLGELSGRLAEALLADPGFLSEAFGSSTTEAEFDKFLKKKFPGLHAVVLDSLLPDESFFQALRTSSNAQLSFDIASYWQDPGPAANDSDALLLRLVNDANSSFSFLDVTVGLNRRAAASIVGHRNGPDGQAGTADDALYDSVAELDQVKYVGSSTINLLRQYAVSHNN
jgi:hypothetical protein